MPDNNMTYAQYLIWKKEEKNTAYIYSLETIYNYPLKNLFKVLDLPYNASFEDVQTKAHKLFSKTSEAMSAIREPSKIEQKALELNAIGNAKDILARVLFLERIKEAISIIDDKQERLEKEILDSNDVIKLEKKNIKLIAFVTLRQSLEQTRKTINTDLESTKKIAEASTKGEMDEKTYKGYERLTKEIKSIEVYQESIDQACSAALKTKGLETLTGGVKKLIQSVLECIFKKPNINIKSDSIKTAEKINATFRLK